MHIIIVGAGFGGLSAAALLAKEGYQVTVFEKNEQIGGRASVYEEDGYYFDMGPSWYLMPDVYEKFYAEFNKKPEDFFQLEKLDPSYRIYFEKDKRVDISPYMEKNIELFNKLEEGGGDKLIKYLKSSQELYDFSVNEMLYKEYKSVLDLFSGKLILKSYKLRLWDNLQEFVDKYFESDEARKILEYAIGFLGGAPANTPSFYHLVSHADLTLGVYYPQGGLRKVAESIKELALNYGVNLFLNEPVTNMITENGRITHIRTEKDVYKADLVIVNADYAYSELQLLSEEDCSYDKEYWEDRTFSPSAMVVYLGINKKVSNLVHHNLFLNKDWEEGFVSIFDPDQFAWPDNPSYYVNVPSQTDRTAAPPGCDTIYILIPLAPGLEDNFQLREGLYEKVMKDLEFKLEENIQDHIQVKKIFALNDFKTRYNAYKGTAFGLSHTLSQTALWRPAHQSKKVKNLYYTGQYTHPGIGVPMTMVSSQIVAREIKEKYGT